MERVLIDMPPEIARLPRDGRGYPVPEFVRWMDDLPDFRILKDGYREECVNKKRCWICGGFMGKRKWFCLGPMCSVTRTTSEPPSHRLCAEFAVKNCPFMTKPLAKYASKDKLPPDAHVDGVMIERNPGVSMIWETLNYKPFKDGMGGWLIQVGDPVAVSAWREGRHATRSELWQSIETGLPALHDMAKREGERAVEEFLRTVRAWKKHVFDRYFPEDQPEEGQDHE